MINIRTGDTAGDTPAFKLISEGVNYLVQDDLYINRGGFPVAPEDRVIYAEDGHEIVGVITFHVRREMGAAYVTLAYVEPASREQGLFKQMWTALQVEAKDLGLTMLIADTHADNITMQSALKRVRASLDGMIYIQPLGA